MANLWRYPGIAGSDRNPISAKTTNVTQGSAYDDVASDALFGTATTVTHYILNVEPSSYTTTGSSVTLNTVRTLVLNTANYALTGFDATLTKATSVTHYNVILETSGYVITGNGLLVTTNRNIALDNTAYTVIGNNITVNANRNIVLNTEALQTVGVETNLSVTRGLLLSPSSYVVSGKDKTYSIVRSLILSPFSQDIIGFDVTFVAPSIVAYQRGGRNKHNVPKWLKRLLENLEDDWASEFVEKVKKEPEEFLEKITEELPYFDLDTKQIYLAIELINKEVKRKKAIRKKQNEEILMFLL